MSRPRALAALLLAATLLAGCAPSEEEVSFVARSELLRRQNQGIRELIQEEEKGSLVPTGRFLVGVHESIVQDLLRSQLPLERPLGKRFVVRLERATVLLRDKFGAITIEGEVHRPATPDRKTAVRILGGLGAVEIDPVTNVLHVEIAIDHIELLQAGILEGILGHGGKKFLAEKGKPLLQDALPQLEVPVALGQSIHVPAIEEGAIRLDPLVIPLHLSVARVPATGGKLWVTLNAEVGKVTGAEQGLGVAVGKKARKEQGR
jgi:hypothetical protein